MTKTLTKPHTDRTHTLMEGYVIGHAYGHHTQTLKDNNVPLGTYGAVFPATLPALPLSLRQEIALLKSPESSHEHRHTITSLTPSIVQAAWLSAMDITLEEKLSIAKETNAGKNEEEAIAAQVVVFLVHQLTNDEVAQGELIQAALDFSANLPETKVQRKLQHAKTNLSAFIKDDQWNLDPLMYTGAGKDSAEILALSLLALDSNPEDEILALRRSATHKGNSVKAAVLTGALLGAAGFDYPSSWTRMVHLAV